VVAGALGARLEARGVEAGVGLGDGEAGLFLALDQRRQHPALLFFGAEDRDGLQAEDVHVHGRSARQARARLRDGLHHHRGFGDAQATATVFGRQADAQPATVSERAVQLVRKAADAVALEPVSVVEAGANLANGLADGFVFFGDGKVHGRFLMFQAMA
jgi:hypothetical protein